MKKIKLHCIALLLLVMAVVPVITAVGFIAGQLIAAHIALENLEKGAAKTYTVAAGQVYWIEEGKECMVYGKLFDVLQYREQKDSIELTGIFDTDEDMLLKKYQDLTHNSKQGKHTHLSFFKIFTSPAIVTKTPEPFCYCICKKRPLALLSETTACRPIKVVSPPPRFISKNI